MIPKKCLKNLKRFSSTYQPTGKRNPRGLYLVPLLRKFLEKTINYEDPSTRKMIKGKVKDAVILRLILNATQGENEAIKEILNRIDGKVAQEIKGEGFGDNKTYVYVVQDTKGRSKNRVQILPTLKPAKD